MGRSSDNSVPCYVWREAEYRKFGGDDQNHTDLIEFVSGLTVPKLNQGCLREIPIPVPLLAEQQRIVGLLDEAFEEIAILGSS